MSHLINILLTSLLCLGIKYCTSEGMIFERPAIWLFLRLPEWMTKPVFWCVTCMGSVYGVLCFCFTQLSFELVKNLYKLPLLPVYCFGIAALNSIIYDFVDYFATRAAYNKLLITDLENELSHKAPLEPCGFQVNNTNTGTDTTE